MSLGDAYFADLYAGDEDPWGFRSRWYERRKRDVTLASLPRERYRNAYEPGCSFGLLTERLAPRCDRVLATDVVRETLEQARRQVGDAPQVRFAVARIPEEWPADERFDLVLLSELGYYLSAEDLAEVVRLCAASLTADGDLVACHWRHPVEDYPLSGDAVHAALRAAPGLDPLAHHEEEDFLLDVLTPSPARSVARREGLLG